MYDREEILRRLSRLYYKFLKNIDWKDKEYVKTLEECRRTYLTYAFLTLLKSRSGVNKYRQTTNYISNDALEVLRTGKAKGLRFEHMIPKKLYIQDKLEDLADKDLLTEESIYDVLEKYWHIAVVTKEEDKKLLRFKMPDDWDEVDYLKRYKEANLLEQLNLNTPNLF